MVMSELKDEVLKMDKQGWVSFSTIEGVMTANIKDFVSQPAEGILYDLNRDKATVLHNLDDPRWVNDFAVNQVITYLKDKYIKDLLDEALSEVEMEEQNITANMDAHQAFDLAKNTLLEYIKSKYE